MIHGIRKNGKAHGVVNTKLSVVKKMLDLVGFVDDRNLSRITVLEPSSGEGAFAIEIINRLYRSSLKFHFDFERALSNVYLYEVNKLRKNIQEQLEKSGSFDNRVNIITGDFLQASFQTKFDLIIGNPPYVRHENIPRKLKSIYQAKYSTFTHRSDLYIPFFEKSLRALKTNAKLSFVCSNRWLKNEYGAKLRKLIAAQYNVELILNLENTNIFNEEVLGYPAIFNISKTKKNGPSKYFEIKDLKALLQFDPTKIKAKLLKIASPDWFSFLFTGATYEKNIKTLDQQNYKIGIGVATGRDAIFIGDNFNGQIEEELLVPILTSKNVKEEELTWDGTYILNPFDKKGNLIDLDLFPKAKKYLFSHKIDLLNRYVAKKNPSNWYETIDKIHYDLISKPKVILPDISQNKFIHVDKGNFYPHHNLYYITGGNYETMCILASILMSDFVYQQLLEIGNKMKGGYPRWQSQNLRKLLLPVLTAIPPYLKGSLLKAYHQKNISAINSIINKERIAEFIISEGQLSLFEPPGEYNIQKPMRK